MQTTLFKNATIITMDNPQVIHNGFVLVCGNKIAYVGDRYSNEISNLTKEMPQDGISSEIDNWQLSIVNNY